MWRIPLDNLDLYRLTDPIAAIYVGWLPGAGAGWKDIKCRQESHLLLGDWHVHLLVELLMASFRNNMP